METSPLRVLEEIWPSWLCLLTRTDPLHVGPSGRRETVGDDGEIGGMEWHDNDEAPLGLAGELEVSEWKNRAREKLHMMIRPIIVMSHAIQL